MGIEDYINKKLAKRRETKAAAAQKAEAKKQLERLLGTAAPERTSEHIYRKNASLSTRREIEDLLGKDLLSSEEIEDILAFPHDKNAIPEARKNTINFVRDVMDERKIAFEALKGKLEDRFNQNKNRHPQIEWTKVEEKLTDAFHSKPKKIRSLHLMEETLGEPDVVDYDEKTGEFIFFDCSEESPRGRRKLRYNQAVAMAEKMGIDMLTKEQYKFLGTKGTFDKESWSWVKIEDPDLSRIKAQNPGSLEKDPDLIKNGVALSGISSGDVIYVNQPYAHYRGADGAFRGSLRV